MDYKTAYERLYRAVGQYIMANQEGMGRLVALQQELEEAYLESPEATMPPED
ncbi:MAG: hypothetical protein GXY32_09130 [Ruminococcaceae bacterium]|nr:hypothetical protein [Oscillospiraceae bacterium]